MKVQETSLIRALQPGKPSEAPKDPRETRAPAADRVSTAATAHVAAAVATAAHGASASRAARLREIETAVKAGTYRPDPQQIAQHILDEAEIAARVQALLQK